jgi:hypothetical protein
MSKFTDRLWRDLVREHGADLAQMDPLANAGHRRRARPRVLAGTGVGIAGLATVAALVLGAASSSPAFAVTRNRDGTYTFQLRSLEAVAAANRTLHGMNLRAQVVPVSVTCNGTMSLFKLQTLASALARARALADARFDPREIPAGKTLLIPAWRVGHEVRVAPATVVVSAVPACLAPPCAFAITRVVPAPAPGNSGTAGANSGDSGSSAANSGNSGPPPGGTASQTAPNVIPGGLRTAHVPASLRARLTTLAKLTARVCQRTTSLHSNSGKSGNSGNSGSSGNS